MHVRYTPRNQRLTALVTCIALCAALLITVVPFARAFNGGLPDRSDQIADSTASATTTHLFGFTITNTTQALGSIELQFCSNGPLAGTPCTAPTGLDLTGASLASQTGAVGFSKHSSSSASRLVLTRPAAATGAVMPSTYRIANVVNPSTPGSYYVRIQTYSSTDASGSSLEDGGVVFAIVRPLDLSTEVPPYLTFCASSVITSYSCATATSYFIDMGEFSTSKATVGSSQFMVGTNAANGFTISISGTTLTSGNNTVTALGSPSAPTTGSSQFGINLRANPGLGIGSDPSGPGTASPAANYATPGLFMFANGDTLVTSPTTTDLRLFTVSYLTNVSSSQPPGVYSSTYTYIALANF